MLFSDPIGDMHITLFLVIVGIIISFVVGLMKRSWYRFFIWASLSGNAVFLLNVFTHSRLFTFYHIEWMKFFSLIVWPGINLMLLFILIWDSRKTK
jgi:hypothetical protein